MSLYFSYLKALIYKDAPTALQHIQLNVVQLTLTQKLLDTTDASYFLKYCYKTNDHDLYQLLLPLIPAQTLNAAPAPKTFDVSLTKSKSSLHSLSSLRTLFTSWSEAELVTALADLWLDALSISAAKALPNTHLSPLQEIFKRCFELNSSLTLKALYKALSQITASDFIGYDRLIGGMYLPEAIQQVIAALSIEEITELTLPASWLDAPTTNATQTATLFGRELLKSYTIPNYKRSWILSLKFTTPQFPAALTYGNIKDVTPAWIFTHLPIPPQLSINEYLTRFLKVLIAKLNPAKRDDFIVELFELMLPSCLPATHRGLLNFRTTFVFHCIVEAGYTTNDPITSRLASKISDFASVNNFNIFGDNTANHIYSNLTSVEISILSQSLLNLLLVKPELVNQSLIPLTYAPYLIEFSSTPSLQTAFCNKFSTRALKLYLRNCPLSGFKTTIPQVTAILNLSKFSKYHRYRIFVIFATAHPLAIDSLKPLWEALQPDAPFIVNRLGLTKIISVPSLAYFIAPHVRTYKLRKAFVEYIISCTLNTLSRDLKPHLTATQIIVKLCKLYNDPTLIKACQCAGLPPHESFAFYSS